MSNIYNYFYAETFNYIFFNSLISDLFEQYLSKNSFVIIFIPISLGLIILFWLRIKVTFFNQILDLNQQLTKQINAKIEAEKTIAKLENKLEHQVLQRTVALSSANQDLKETTRLMEKVANLTPNILYVYDLERKYNVYANRFVGEILGYSPTEIEQMNVHLFDKLIHPEDLELVKQHHQNCLNLEAEEYLELEYRMQDRFGAWHWLHSKDTVFERNKAGKPTQILGITQDISETKKIQAESAKLNQQLAEQVFTLETWHDERIRLGQMNEFLQSCEAIGEAEAVLSDLLPKLFPQTHGAVYLMNNSKRLLKAIAAWGLSNSSNNFEPNQCWALRRGNVHLVDSVVSNLCCSHAKHPGRFTSTLCQPMIAKGETLGMLYLRFNHSTAIDDLVQELAETVAQNIAMSLANLTLQEELRYQSLRDPLTGLFNRRYLQESLVKEIERAHRKQHFIGLMMLDIDHFKHFNDTYGHIAGDYVLQTVCAYLVSQTRQYDIACRYGGEELVLVMPDTSLENTIIRAEEIRQGISKLQLEHEGKKLDSVTVSIGVSCFPDDGTAVASLVAAADKALYQAKKEGRNCVKR